jgi:hypothetical protein
VRIVEGDLSAIPRRKLVDLAFRLEKIADRRTSLYEVIRDDDMDRIIGSPLRHVTVEAGGGGCHTLQSRRRRVMDVIVTTLANRYIVANGLLSAWDVMRIVTCGACHLALEKTC